LTFVKRLFFSFRVYFLPFLSPYGGQEGSSSNHTKRVCTRKEKPLKLTLSF